VRTNGRDIRFTEPLYTIAEASAFLGVRPSTLATWIKGYERRPPGRKIVRGKAIVVVREYLECITYGDDDWPTLLLSPVTRAVAADPKRSFGQPIFSHGAAPVEAVVDRWEAGDTIAELSADFCVPERDIEDALRARLRVAA